MKNKVLLAIVLILLVSSSCFAGSDQLGVGENISPTVASFLTEANLTLEQNWQNNAYQVEGRVASEAYDMQKIIGSVSTTAPNMATVEASLYQDSNKFDEFSIPGLKVSVTDASKLSAAAKASSIDSNMPASINVLNQRFGYAEASLNSDGSVFAGTYLSSKLDAGASGKDLSLSGESLNAKSLTVMGDNFFSQSNGSISIQPSTHR